MGDVERYLVNAWPTTSLLYRLRVMWKSPRGTVIRIQALALVAIGLSFLLAAFGFCRRWSNRWIIQKGFWTAQVLSLSLGAYSIGLMQSLSIKSEMYPIWAVSLLALFGCIDPVTTYIGLDYKGPLSKMIFQICLYCVCVLLMSSSTISSDVGKVAIGLLCAITFFKGFHKSLAFVQQRKTRADIEWLVPTEPDALVGNGEGLGIHLRSYVSQRHKGSPDASGNMADIDNSELKSKEVTGSGGMTIADVCLGYSLSHLLQRRFLGLDNAAEMKEKRDKFKSLARDGKAIDYNRTLKVIEVELAFLYEVYFTSNEFLHLYQAETASFWAIASFIGICFLGIVAVIPGTMASRHRISCVGPGACNIVVNTTIADLIITLVILVSLALLQLMQLIRCWASNWARVAFASQYIWNQNNKISCAVSCGWWMSTKEFAVTKINWFDSKYLWQDKLGQHSVVATRSWEEPIWEFMESRPWISGKLCLSCKSWGEPLWKLWLKCKSLLVKVGVHYFWEVLRELLVCETAKTVSAVRLHDDVKACIAEFLGHIKSSTVETVWTSSFVDKGVDKSYLPYSTAPVKTWEGTNMTDASAFTHRVMVWHIATCYCELAEQEASATSDGGAQAQDTCKHRLVAITLSKYCSYLVASAPDLLPGSSAESCRALQTAARETKRAYGEAAWQTRVALRGESDKLEAMKRHALEKRQARGSGSHDAFGMGVELGRLLRNEVPPEQRQRQRCRSSDHWELLARLWVQTLLYAAPYGNVQAHMQRLSQGGEFITHIWALLYHLGIDKWETAAGETKEEESV